jgi:hypothetical protein
VQNFILAGHSGVANKDQKEKPRAVVNGDEVAEAAIAPVKSESECKSPLKKDKKE